MDQESNTIIALEVAKDRSGELVELRNRLGLSNNKDLVNVALTLLEGAVDALEDGYTIAFVKEEKKFMREVTMPCFANIIKKSQSQPR